MATEEPKDTQLHLVGQDEALLPAEQAQKLQLWFLEPSSRTDNTGDLNRHLSVRTAHTGSWIQSTTQWKEWVSMPKNILWLHGGPGVGKSVLTACAIDHLSSNPAPVMYFFFRGSSSLNQDMNQFIRSLLSQLVPHSVSLQGILRPLLDRGSQVGTMSIHDLCQAFIAGLRSVGMGYLVVDALDETTPEQAATVLQLLRQVSVLDNVKILVASRPSIRPLMEKYLDSYVPLELEGQQGVVQLEISLFIKEQLHQAIMETSATESLCEVILARSKGNFLTARILLDQLLLEKDWVGVYKDQTSPSDHFYTTVLQEQAARLGIESEVQIRLLGYVAFCYRPLRLREMAGLLVAASLADSISAAEKIVREACFPLLQIGKDEVVRLVHQSVLEYLTNNDRPAHSDGAPLVKEVEVHESLALLCLSAILEAGPNPEQEKLIVQVAYIQYAQASWPFHLSHLRHQEPPHPQIVTTLESICRAEVPLPKVRSLPTLLHVAAFVGLESLAEQLIANGDPWLANLKPERNVFNGQEKVPWHTTPLSVAASAGHVSIVKMLWTDDMLTRLGDYRHELVLEACTNTNGEDVVRFLMAKGCTPPSGEDRFGSYQNSLLQFRFSSKVLPLLVPYMDKELHVNFITQSAVLARNDALKAVLTMLQSSGIAPWRSAWTGTPLYQVCGAKDKTFFHVESVKLLLGAYPNVNERERPRRMFIDQYHSHRPLPTSGGTAVHALTATWSDENHDASAAIFSLLMKQGADLEVRDDDGQTPLCMLFWSRNVRSVYKPLRTLIDAVVDIDVLDTEGNDLLMRVVRTTRDVGALKRVMYADQHRKHGPPKWDRAYLKQRPYLGCLWDNTNGPDGQQEVVEYLLSLGCTVEDGGEGVKTTLAIVRRGSVALLERVLRTRSSDGFLSDVLHGFWNAALRREEQAQDDSLNVLIQAGGDINHKNNQGRTPIMSAVTSLRAIDLLIQRGADVHARDDHGRGMIHHLLTPSSWPDECQLGLRRGEYPPLNKLLAKLISVGSEVNTVDKEGKTALHYAVSLFTDAEAEPYMRPQPFDPQRHPVIMLLRELVQHVPLTSEMISSALAQFFDVTARQSRRPLSMAKDYFTAVLEIFSRTAVNIDLNVANEAEPNPLMMASMNLDSTGLPCLQILLEHGSRVDVVTAEGKNVLHLACLARNPTTLGYLLDKHPELAYQRDHNGKTPLFEACRAGMVESVLLLLEAGSDAAVKDYNGHTLKHACAEFELEHTEWQKGALCLARHEAWDDYDISGNPYLADLSWLGHQGRTEWMEKRQGRALKHPLIAIKAVTQLLRYYDAAGVLDMRDEEDTNRDEELDRLIAQKPLIQPDHFLSQSQSVKDLQWVLGQDIDLFSEYEPEIGERKMSSMDRDLQGGEAWATRLFKVALQTGNTEAVRGLLSPGEVTDNMMASYFHGVSKQHLLRTAARSPAPNVAMLQFFIHHCHFDVDPPSLSPEEVTLLAQNDTSGFVEHISPSTVHLLSSGEHYWHVLALKYLIANGQPDLNLKSYDGDTPLHVACQSSSPWAACIAKLLLSSGADASVRNANGHLCTRSVPLPEVESVLSSFSVPVDGNATEALALAIGKLHVEKVRKAIERGANVRDRIEDPVWSEEDYDSGHNGAVVGNGWPAVPLLAALQLVTSEQEQQPGARAAILRMLVDAGASFAEEIDVYDLTVYDEQVAGREQPPKWYWEECCGDDAFIETMPFLHAAFKYVRCHKKYLDVLFWEFKDRVMEMMEIEGGDAGETLLLAMCNASRDVGVYDEGGEEDEEDEHPDGSDSRKLKASNPLGYFLPLLDLGPDISATDANGNTALHILLKNSSMDEDLVCQFINHPSTLRLHHQPDSQGWLPFQLAAKILRPEALLTLIRLHPELKQRHGQDPDGFSMLHRIAQQSVWAATCPGYSDDKAVRHSKTYIESCLQLWKTLLAQGADIDAPDGTEEGNPPLFHYLTQLGVNDTGTGPHTTYFGAFFTKDGYPQDKNQGNGFQSANFRIRNKRGDTLLHAVVKAGVAQWGGRDLEAARLLQMIKEKCYLDTSERDADGRSVAEVIGASRSKRLKGILED